MSRKFFIAVSILVIATAGLFDGQLDGGEFVTLTIAILGIYGYHNVKAREAGEV